MGRNARQPPGPPSDRAQPGPATGSVEAVADEPIPLTTIEIGVDVCSGADGTWSVVLTPAIASLRTKRRDGLATLAAVQAQVWRMLEALAYGGFPVATTWTLDGDPGGWLAHADHDGLTNPSTTGTPRRDSARPGGSGREVRR